MTTETSSEGPKLIYVERTYSEKLLGWILLLLSFVVVALVVIAIATVSTAVNTRELCEDQDSLAYLGSSCSF